MRADEIFHELEDELQTIITREAMNRKLAKKVAALPNLQQPFLLAKKVAALPNLQQPFFASFLLHRFASFDRLQLIRVQDVCYNLFCT